MSSLASPLTAYAKSSSYSSTYDDRKTFKIAVMGASAVGKSAIIGQLIQGKFLTGHWATIKDCYTKDMDINGNYVVLDIFDTPGACWFSSIRSLAIKNADAFVLVYSVGDKASFESMARIRAMIIKQKADGVPVIVVGNKTDVTSSPRFISKQWAENTVVNVWKHLYMEVTATQTEAITQIFREIAIKARHFVEEKRGIKLPLALLNNVRRYIRSKLKV